ncbi:Hypothetical predicted protein [Olea europaea subsp. europaea]|uniref:Uncharacterized protein n=1 Tax=Olea europaea subsp. europaea TaxID=158383 RepID=A0A8S0RSE0_OLEEU|nr:Hypothetical predicted protein [Olea europaea subsp. europaea]
METGGANPKPLPPPVIAGEGARSSNYELSAAIFEQTTIRNKTAPAALAFKEAIIFSLCCADNFGNFGFCSYSRRVRHGSVEHDNDGGERFEFGIAAPAPEPVPAGIVGFSVVLSALALMKY